MSEKLKDYAKIGLNHHMMYPCRDDPDLHVSSLELILTRDDIQVVDLTIPYGESYRDLAIALIKESGKSIVHNGYLMPTKLIPLGTLSYTEHNQILMLAKDQVDAAREAGVKFFMQSVGADPGYELRKKAFDNLGEYIRILDSYMKQKSDMTFLIEIMDRDTHRKSLCGPSNEVLSFLDGLKKDVPDIGVVLDINHMLLMNEPFDDLFNAFKDYLKHLHLGNCILKNKYHHWWGAMHPPMGIEGGEIDTPQLAKILKNLLDIGYLNNNDPGALSLEIRAFPGKTPNETIEDNISRIYKAWDML